MRPMMRIAAVAAACGMLAAGAAAPARADVAHKTYKTNFRSGLSVARKAAPARRHRTGVRKVRLARSRLPGMNACKAAARRFGVPISTALAVCRLESGFRCSAVGRAGELGLLQMKLATARGIGYRGSRRGLLSCSTGAYWGMKHLAMAIRRGGVWKHNQGLGAKRPSKAARIYARKVAALKRRYR